MLVWLHQASGAPYPFSGKQPATLLGTALVKPLGRCRVLLWGSVKVTYKNWAKNLKGMIQKDIYQ